MDINHELSHVAVSIVERAKRRRAQEEAQDVAQQKCEGNCSLIPFPQVATQPFRSELVLERHPLFVVNAFKDDCFIHERTVEHPESGEPIVQRVMVGKTDVQGKSYGVLKQVHQEVFYKLLKLWGDQGYPLEGTLGVIKTTVYDLVRALRGNDAAPHYRRVKELIRDLSSIPITLENGYTWQGLQDLDEFSLIADVKWNVRKLNKETLRPKQGGISNVKIFLSETVTEGFLRKNVKQLLWQPYAALGKRAQIARLLYPILDYELASKDHFHIALRPLAARLGMAIQRYKSDRKRPFAQAIKHLQGKPILGEKYKLHLQLTDAADGDDVILKASRRAFQLEFQGV